MTPLVARPVTLLRNHVFKVSAVADVADRVAELETGVAESRRQLPALTAVVDRLAAEVVDLAERRLAGAPEEDR